MVCSAGVHHGAQLAARDGGAIVLEMEDAMGTGRTRTGRMTLGQREYRTTSETMFCFRFRCHGGYPLTL